MTYGNQFRPYRIRTNYCSKNDVFKCSDVPIVDQFKHNSIYRTQPFIISTYVNVATKHSRSGYTRINYGNRDINIFGKWEGVSGGSGNILRNKY